MDWGPYKNQTETRDRLGAFADAVLQRRVGIIWSAGDDAIWLRHPFFDGQGYGLTLLARYDGGKRSPTPSPSMVDRLDRYLGGFLTRVGQQQVQQSQMNMEIARAQGQFISQHIIQPVNEFIGRYEYVKDGVAVVFDVAAVIAGGAAAVALITVGGGLVVTIGLAAGVLAGLAGLALLVEDGRHMWFTMRGDEAGKLGLESTADFQWIEAVGPLIALPDLAISGRAALREMITLTQDAGRAAQNAGTANRLAQGATRELREVVADADQSAVNLARVANQASERAADYRRMQDQAKQATQKLLMAREAVLSYAGTTYGAGMYALQPPELAQRLFSPTPPVPPSATRLPAQPAGANDNPWRLLEPSDGTCQMIPKSGLHFTMLVSSRPKMRPRR